jgi:hypothetical protein
MHVACPPAFFPVNLANPTGAVLVAVRACQATYRFAHVAVVAALGRSARRRC